MADATLNEHQRRQLLERIRQHEVDFAKFVNRRQATVAILLELADELNSSKRKVRISKISGAVGGVVSAGLTIAGLATIPLFGVGVVLTAAGAGVGVLSGVTSAGAAIGDIVVSKNTRMKCNKVLEADNQAVLDYQNAMEGFRLFIHSIRGVAPIGSVVTAGIQLVRLVDVLLDASGATLRGVGAAIDAVPIVGAVFNLITLPIDIGTLISNARDIHKSTPHQVAASITEVAQQLQDQLRELQLRHDKEMEELQDALLSENRISAREIAFYVCVIVVLAIINFVLFWFQAPDGPPLLTYDLPMLPFD
ncbi:uncharacterized protein LOC130010240 [Patella vulgata]|uniref:uncharacterized protein LOC130010240 n=1 Tax=Patella vulgata TaxID=6465 RepID=UPI00217F3CB2|nr:uncharacterized protein LOC130010240 [Patella vulgata]XP_055958014.1 uncharacterized protein LOC130010240 [Patella vulgata]XP_055958015.1 uncharacterized protein LOC130010240 [Patella vulgata]XP_055958016.1 uncharacterized protein LOC130010240 [Patella vulgata]